MIAYDKDDTAYRLLLLKLILQRPSALRAIVLLCHPPLSFIERLGVTLWASFPTADCKSVADKLWGGCRERFDSSGAHQI